MLLRVTMGGDHTFGSDYNRIKRRLHCPPLSSPLPRDRLAVRSIALPALEWRRRQEGRYYPRVKIAAGAVVMLLGVIIVFQMAVALGAPLGKAAWGGQHEGVLPKRLRIASGVAALVIYPFILVAVLGSAGFIEGDFLPWNDRQLMWLLGGLFMLGGIANLVSRSTIERYWAPVSIAIAICCWIIASSP